MTHAPEHLKRLDEIKSSVGAPLFQSWLEQADRTFRRSQYKVPGMNHAEIKHAFIYQEIVRQYETYESVQKANRNAGREFLGEWSDQ